jgi:hypothetical protein
VVNQTHPGTGDSLLAKDTEKLGVADAVKSFLHTKERRVQRCLVLLGGVLE